MGLAFGLRACRAAVPVGGNHAPNSRSLAICSHPDICDLPGSTTGFRGIGVAPYGYPFSESSSAADGLYFLDECRSFLRRALHS